MKKKQQPSNIKSLITSGLIIAFFVGAVGTLYFNFGMPGKQTAFFARSINDASYDCENKIDQKFDEDLVNKYYDGNSSRYDSKQRQYIIYYRVSARYIENDIPMIKDYMAKCIVWERIGYVSDFQIFDDF
ncbi:MAG: hypothetical protein V3T17_17570 [Pseudomonadales bacterium]